MQILRKKARRAVREKRPHGYHPHFHMDNARPHTSHVSLDALEDLDWSRVPQAPYSPDTSPCDFHLFSNLKRGLRGIRLETEEELQAAVRRRLDLLSTGGFRRVFRDWVDRHRKVIAAGGDYFE